MNLPTDPKDVAAIRTMLETIRQQVCGVGDTLPEPWKTHFLNLKEQYNSFLSKLPPSDQAPAALDANAHLSMFASCLAGASSLATMLGAQLNSQHAAMNSAVDAEITKRITGGELIAKDAVAGLIAKGIEDKVKAGELLDKTTHSQLCSAAKTAGVTEGRTAVEQEVQAKEARVKLITERKGQLQTAGLPMPEATLEAILGGTPEEFTQVKSTVETRIAALQQKGVAVNSASAIGGKLYLPEDQWKVFEELAVSAVKGGDPLRGSQRPPEDQSKPRVMLV